MNALIAGAVVAIHQPNFFPWLGFFDKMVRADRLVLLDDVQFPRRAGGSWGNRVRVQVSGKPQWFTATLERSFEGTRLYSEMRFHPTEPWRQKLLRVLEGNYRKTPHFSEAIELVKPLVENDDDVIATYNATAICSIADALMIDSGKIRLSSSLHSEGVANQRLISLTRSVSGSVYLAGGGASGYQDDEAFAKAGLGLHYQRFEHPRYPQANNLGDFLPGLSVIDALMNVGVEGTAELLKGARQT